MSSISKIHIVQAGIGWKDPHIWDDSRDRRSILFSVYDPLMKVSDSGFSPCLAECWELSDDAKTWTFHIRKDVKFHNGQTLTAQDVAYSLNRAADPDIPGEWGTTGVYRTYMGDSRLTVSGPYTVELVTATAMADLPDLLLDVPIVQDGTGDKQKGEAIGTGPYKLESFDKDSMTMVRHEEYWRGSPPYEELTWTAEADHRKRAEAVVNGKAHIASNIKPAEHALIESAQGVSLTGRESSVCVVLFCKCASGPCRDERVRLALNYGLDVRALIEELGRTGASTPLNFNVGPANMGYTHESGPIPYDPEKAKALLKTAGYAEGLELTLSSPNRTPDESLQLIELIRRQYETLGIKVNISVTEDRALYAENVRDKKFGDLCVFDSSPGSTFRVLREKINSSLAGPWWQGYDNPAVNAELERISAVSDVESRRDAYKQVLIQIRDEAPWVYLYSDKAFWAVDLRLTGFTGGYDSTVSVY